LHSAWRWAAAFLLVWPVYTDFDGERTTRHAARFNGAWVIIPVMFTVLVAVVPLVFRKRVVRIAARHRDGLVSFAQPTAALSSTKGP
jgi:hypothetical protein